MPATLADSLDLALASAPEALVPAETRAPLRGLAGRLAPVHRAGFEVRLGNGASRAVDLQQGIPARDGAPLALRSHVARSTQRGGLDAFVSAWADTSGPLHEAIDDLWLEYDSPPASTLSMFVGFARGPGDRVAATRQVLDLLGFRDAWGSWGATFERCVRACPGGAHVSHVGLMVGRPSPVLRVNVKRLDPEGLAGYLTAVAWPGDAAAAVALAERVRPLVDGVAVCLDVGERVHGRLGLECHLDRQPPQEPRWAALLDEVVAAGWCSSAQRDALLAWPGWVTPADAPGPWPPDLVRASLRRPADHFSTIQKGLSHVKLTIGPDGGIAAKGYFGFEHRWRRPALGAAVPARLAARDRSRAPGIAGAIAFLLASRTPAGWWADFSGLQGTTGDPSMPGGPSDEWVTAYVAASLAAAPGDRAREACRQAWDLLVERRAPLAGWGWNRHFPVDADSTAWALRLAGAIGEGASWPARRARAMLEHHRLSGGGVTTFEPLRGLRPRGRLTPPDGNHHGWHAAVHACVTAAVGDDGARGWLREAQRDDGSWRAYWWEDDEYATALAAEELARAGGPGDGRRVAAAVGWALDRLGADGSAGGSPFAAAFCVRLLALSNDTAAAKRRARAVDWLSAAQHDDGGWEASARLVAPRPDLVDRPADPSLLAATLDEARTFTTATVLSARLRSAG